MQSSAVVMFIFFLFLAWELSVSVQYRGFRNLHSFTSIQLVSLQYQVPVLQYS